MIKIGLIGTQSMHGWAFAEVCNIPDENGNYLFPDARITSLWGPDDTDEHIAETMQKGNVCKRVDSFEQLLDECNAFMILQRDAKDHLHFAEKIIKMGYPVFIDKPVCKSSDEGEHLQSLAEKYNCLIVGGSGFKHSKTVKRLKKSLENQEFGKVKGATITGCGDISCEWGGIFFYLPHTVEIMLELFGYNPKSVMTTVLSDTDFTVCVKYDDKIINLAITNTRPTTVMINAKENFFTQIGIDDIFSESMRHFVTSIKNGEFTKDTSKLTRHISVLEAIDKSIKTKAEIIL